MHVGLNLIFLVPGETGGMEVYARELIPALIEQASADTRFTAFVNREAAAGDGPWRSLVPAVTVPVRASSRAQWVLGEQALLPRMAASAGVEVLHSLASTAPLWGSQRRVTTVHDLIYAHFPEAHSGLRARGMGALVPRAAHRSERVIVDSASTREDVISLLGVDPARVDVVPLGLGAHRDEHALGEHEVRERFGLGSRPLLLTLSAKRPHKNLPALIGALALLAEAERPVLVMPGYRTEHEADLCARAQALGVLDSVRLPGWVSPQELEGLWGAASAFVYPSLYEGFGLPVLEAMARGVPVACSDASSLPEVAGDAALMFDPRDEGAIAQAITRLLGDGELSAGLARRGRERAQQFSWERTARLTLASYERALFAP